MLAHTKEIFILKSNIKLKFEIVLMCCIGFFDISIVNEF